jgi:hypothetical protein
MKGIKYTPILYSTPMVKSLSKFIKTVTRRTLKPQPNENGVSFMANAPLDWEQIYNEAWTPWKWETEEGESISKNCPYGNIGDILWVKETFYAYGHWTTITENGKSTRKFYDLTHNNSKRHQYFAEWQPEKAAKFGELGWHKRPALFMPKVAARLFLLITDIRVERLQDITNEQAIKEGIAPMLQSSAQIIQQGRRYLDYTSKSKEIFHPGLSAKQSFMSLWFSINGVDSWEANPYVWVIEFKRVDCPADFYSKN